MKDFFFKHYLTKPADEPLLINRRQGKFYGSCGKPGPLVREIINYNIKRTFGNNLLGMSVQGVQWDTQLDVTLPQLLPEKLEGRLSNIATWHLSYNELYRIGLRQKQFFNDEKFLIVRDILDSYKDKIIETWKQHYESIAKLANYDKFERYVLDPKHKKSSVPGDKGKWLDLPKHKLRQKFKEITEFNEYLVEHFDDIIGKGWIISEPYKVQALRYRSALEGYTKRRNKILARHHGLRMRTATGVWPFSQNGYVYYKEPELKAKIFKPWFDLYKEIAGGIDCHLFAEEKTKLYLDIINASKITYADLSSGETQWGNTIGEYLPISSSIYAQNLIPIVRKGDSGLELTPTYNALLSAAHGRMLLEEGLIGKGTYYGIGSDNVMIIGRDDVFDEEHNIYGGLAKAENFYGFQGKHHYPLNLIKDGARSNMLWNGSRKMTITSKVIPYNSLLSVIIMYDLLHTGATNKLYSKVNMDYEGYFNVDVIDKAINEEGEKFRDMFSEEYQELLKLTKLKPEYQDVDEPAYQVSVPGKPMQA